MILTVLGSGEFLTLENFHSNFLITSDEGQRLLINCGSDIKFSLNNINIKPSSINGILILDLHGDHSGGLEYIAFYNHFIGKRKLDLFIPKELYNDLWDMLKPSLKPYLGKSLKLEDYFNVYQIEDNGNFEFGLVLFKIVQTVHFHDDRMIVPSYGFIVKYMDKQLFFTSDTQFNTNLIPFYNQADLILQECETSNYKSGVHSNINDLITLESSIKSKMYLYHIGDDVISGNFDMYKLKDFYCCLKPGDKIDFRTMKKILNKS